MNRSVTTACCMLIIQLSGCKPSAPINGPIAPGRQMADSISVRLLNLDQQEVSPFSAGQTHALDVFLFTLVDCPVSNRYAPEIKRLHRKFREKVRFHLVYPDPDTDSDSIRAHLKEYGYALDALLDPQHRLVRWSGVGVTPEAVVVDANREILYRGRIDNWYEDLGRNRPEPTTHELEWAIEAGLDGEKLDEPFPRGVGCYIGDLLTAD